MSQILITVLALTAIIACGLVLLVKDGKMEKTLPRCRCGKKHSGAYALEDWSQHQCLHGTELLGIEVEQGKMQVVCPQCGQSWIVR